MWRVLSVLGVFLAWEIAGRVPVSFAFPPFSEVLTEFVQMLVDGTFLRAYASTAQGLVLGVLISTVFGLALGIGIGLSRFAEWLLVALFVVLYAAPMAALIPLITFLYGIGLVAKTVAVLLLALPVVTLNSYQAVRNVNPSLISMSESFLASRWQQIFKVIIPDATPVIFAGLRLGVAGGFIGIVLAELLITPTGVGDLIAFNLSVAEYAKMYAAIVSIMLLSMLTLAALQALETRVLRPDKEVSR
jgi:NitT/TauT family transport system permease protein